jgi:DNA invertase Pin-like site-specific DNA recombinase
MEGAEKGPWSPQGFGRGYVAYAREEDALVVTKICRLARSVANLVEIIGRLEKTGVTLRIPSMGIDTGTPTGRLMLNLLASISQFEGEVVLETPTRGWGQGEGRREIQGP